MKKLFLFQLLILSLVLTTGCKKDDGDDDSSSSFSGTYKISMWVDSGCDSQSNNISVNFGSDDCAIVEGIQYCALGSMNFGDSGNFTNTMKIRDESNDSEFGVFSSGTGTYIRSGSVLTVCDGDDNCIDWTVNGNSINYTFDSGFDDCATTITMNKS